MPRVILSHPSLSPSPSPHPLSTYRSSASLRANKFADTHFATKTTLNGATISSNSSTKVTKPTHILSLLTTYTRAGLMDGARKLFDEMPERNLIAWTVLMSGYSLHGPAFEAVSLFRDMLRRQPPLRPDPFVFSVVLRACSLAGSFNHGRELHCMILKLFYIEDLFVANGLVSIYANCGSITYSELVFLRIRRPDLVSWTSMLSGYMKNGLDDDALELFNDMAWRGSRFDAFALSVGLKASSNLGCVRSGIQIHCVMIKMGFTSCLFLQNCVIEFYGRIGELVAMKQVFDKLDEKDLVSWNTVIECYAYNCCHGQALSLFRILMDEDLICDRFTLVSILQAVAGLGAVDHGKEIHGYLIRTGFASDSHVISALLDMYIEFGSLNDECNVVPLKLFTHFLSTGAKVDEFIFASTLKHCAVRLDLETGRLIHACVAKLGMDSDAHVVSSLIDMYSKCGILDSSYCLFSRIEHPDVVTWSSIISGSCSNGQFEKVCSSSGVCSWITSEQMNSLTHLLLKPALLREIFDGERRFIAT
uniref:Pentatricopeptide repeat-containing protein n=1 Tax=Ananas comosus var. bracteatus TaxID=296719 RepID=A0A6V7QSK3_ANACO